MNTFKSSSFTHCSLDYYTVYHKDLKSHVILRHLVFPTCALGMFSVIDCSSVMNKPMRLKSIAIRAAFQKGEGWKWTVKWFKFYRATRSLQSRLFYAYHGCMIPCLCVFSNTEIYPGRFHLMSVVWQPSLSILLPKAPFTQFNFLPLSAIFVRDRAPPSLLFNGYQSLSQW